MYFFIFGDIRCYFQNQNYSLTKDILIISLSSEVRFLPVLLCITLAVALPPPPQIF